MNKGTLRRAALAHVDSGPVADSMRFGSCTIYEGGPIIVTPEESDKKINTVCGDAILYGINEAMPEEEAKILRIEAANEKLKSRARRPKQWFHGNRFNEPKFRRYGDSVFFD